MRKRKKKKVHFFSERRKGRDYENSNTLNFSTRKLEKGEELHRERKKKKAAVEKEDWLQNIGQSGCKAREAYTANTYVRKKKKGIGSTGR